MRRVVVSPAGIGDLAVCVHPDSFRRSLPLLEGVADAFRGEDGDLVCVAGLTLVNQSTAEAWNIPGPHFREYLGAPRAIRERLVHHARRLGLRRVQSTVLSSDATSLRFDTWLGFREESRLPDFGPGGEDAVIMRWRESW